MGDDKRGAGGIMVRQYTKNHSDTKWIGLQQMQKRRKNENKCDTGELQKVIK